MRKLILGAVLALALPAAAVADEPAPSPTDLAKTACKTEKHDTGTKVFKLTYAAKSTAKAMQACVAKTVPAAETEKKNAAQACKEERAADAAAFAEKYGTNKNKKNAYGKCVSDATEEAVEEETEDRVNAAKTCKAQRKDSKTEFDAEWGTKKNAFGKCVSATAKADDDEA
jgi:hypothetical protein